MDSQVEPHDLVAVQQGAESDVPDVLGRNAALGLVDGADGRGVGSGIGIWWATGWYGVPVQFRDTASTPQDRASCGANTVTLRYRSEEPATTARRPPRARLRPSQLARGCHTGSSQWYTDHIEFV